MRDEGKAVKQTWLLLCEAVSCESLTDFQAPVLEYKVSVVVGIEFSSVGASRKFRGDVTVQLF